MKSEEADVLRPSLLPLLLSCCLALGACSSDDDDDSNGGGEDSPPSIQEVVQNRDFDPGGMTIDVRFSEPIAEAAAEMVSTWTLSSGSVVSAELLPDGRRVRLVADQVVLPCEVTLSTAAPMPATGNVAIAAQPDDGDTVTISDGSSAETFEFTSGGGAAGGNVEVIKGIDVAATVASFVQAVNAQAFGVTASVGAGASADLVNDDSGVDGNVPITTVDPVPQLTVTGMSGGAGIEDEDGDPITGTLTGITIESTDTSAPSAESIEGIAVAGVDNDQIAVTFDDDMIEAEVEDLTSWTVEAPIGTPFDLTGATVDYDPDTRTATVTLGAGTVGTPDDENDLQTGDTIAASFTGLRDIACNTIDPTTIGGDAVQGVVGGDDEPPVVLAATADGGTTVHVRFSEPVEQVAFADLYSGGTDPGARLLLIDASSGSAQVFPIAANYAFDADGAGVTLDYAPTVPEVGSDSLEVYGIVDLAGNQLFADEVPIIAEDTSAPSLDTGATGLSANEGSGNDTIVFVFESPMSPTYITDPSNYSADPLDLSDATFTFDGVDTVTVTLDGDADQDVQFGDSYDLTVIDNPATPITTAQGVGLSGDLVDTSAATGDSSAIAEVDTTATLGDAGNPNTVLVHYPEAVEPTGAADPSNYSIAAVEAIDAELVAPNVVRLTFAGQPLATEQLDIVAAAATDLGGNVPAGPLAVTIDDVDVTDPTATVSAEAVEGVGGDFIVVDFDETTELSGALDPANYSVTQNSADVDLGGATLSWDDTADAVRIELADGVDLTQGASLDVDIDGVEDLSGNTLGAQPASTTVGGDVTPPDFEAAFVNWIEDPTGQTIDVLFNEAVDADFVGEAANWATGGSAAVTDATVVGPRRVRLTTVPVIGAADSLELTLLPDLAGNTSGLIAIDPEE